MDPEQLKSAANAFCAIMEAADTDFDTLADCLEGIVFSAEELSQIRDRIANF